MRRVLPGLAALLTCVAATAHAQQGSIQISAAAQSLTGDPQRLGGQNQFEPDFGIAWLEPGTRFGIFQAELRATRRRERLHPGKSYVSLRDFKYRGLAWSFEAGDTWFAPPVSDYRFTNLFAPAVTFNGAAVAARSPRTSLQIVAGKTTAWRNIFGTDPQTLEQGLGLARAAYRATSWLEVSARASRVRTDNLKEFSYSIAASDQVGGGVKLTLTPSIYVVGDGSYVSYRRIGTETRERDASGMVGLSWLHRRGWVQVNASRFSPGDLPVLNAPLPDRASVFAAGDYDLMPRVRVFAGADVFETNLYPLDSLASARPVPRSTGSREFGGVRVQLTSRSTVTLRGEWGDRRSRPLTGTTLGSDSDTGTWSAEWRAAVGGVSAFARYAERRNVEHRGLTGSYTQRDVSAQLFATLTRRAQLFGTVMTSRQDQFDSGGNTYWQTGGGGQFQLTDRGLWLRGEALVSRNVDLLTQNFVPRESFSFGLNGQISAHTGIGLDVNVDRSPMPLQTGTPWMSRSLLRVTRTLPTGSSYVSSSSMVSEAALGRGTASIVGSVFTDWNGNGVADPGDTPLEGIPMKLGAANATITGRDGRFAFLNVPVGTREVGLDTAALPIDFDPPEVAQIEIALTRGDNQRVSFGLIPLGTIQGLVMRDVNRNGRADEGDETIDAAVVVLDDGARSEQVRGGRFRFDAVRAGSHRVKLLAGSLPDSAVITGQAEVPIALVKDSLSAETVFLVAMDKRPEIRRVFPPKGGGAATPAPSSGRGGRGAAAARPGGAAARQSAGSAAGRPATAAARTAASTGYTIQIAALSDSTNAQALLAELKASGLPAYIKQPGLSDPALYRIRVGPYKTRAAAENAVTALERQRGEKLWVTRER
jgi:cell division septation protein DedD